jgi:4-hydroxy-3-methylbut-2-enyl diphosphate reductase
MLIKFRTGFCYQPCTFATVIFTMKKFDVPIIYRSPLIAAIKNKRREQDKMKKPASPAGRDFTPTLLDYGPLKIYLARHFGFCYGVENAIEIAFRTIEENPGKRIFLLSEMIHNPQVNADLLEKGVQFLQDTHGKQVIPFNTLNKEDVVIIPAFGTTLDIEKQLTDIGIETYRYNTTCPFVEKVWNRSEQIAKKKYTVVVHGKPTHEETRATFSHASAHTPTIIVNDLNDAVILSKYITGERNPALFSQDFAGKCSAGFDVQKDLDRIGVVNQTTMLASDTQEIADFLKQVMMTRYNLGENNIELHFAETRDTLCYATNDNQSAVYGLLQQDAELAIVVGGYNSSNTSHLVELCESRLPTYFISSEEKILSDNTILHFNMHTKSEQLTENFLTHKKPVRILMTSGASCPDALVEGVINKLKSYFSVNISGDELLRALNDPQ